MRNIFVISLIALMLVLFAGCGRMEKPPRAPMNIVTDNYFGVSVSDPYRYMENMDDTIFLDWMKEYAQYTRSILDAIPGRQSLMESMVDFDARKSDKISYLTITDSGLYFYLKMTPADEKSRLYYRDGYEGAEVLLFDPDQYSNNDSDNFSISWTVPSKDGQKVAIALAANGSESSNMILLDVESGKKLPDYTERTASKITWVCDGEGYVYTQTNSEDIHDPERYLNMNVYYHELGTLNSRDLLVFSSERYPEINIRPEEIPFLMYDEGQGFMFLALYTVERNLKLFYAPCSGKNIGNIRWKPLTVKEDRVSDFYVKHDSIYLYSSKNAPNFQLLCTSLKNPDIPNARIVIPEHKQGILSGYAFTNEALYYKLKFNGVQEKLFRIPNGKNMAERIEFPIEAGSAWISTRGHKFPDIWITLTGWTLDGKRYRYQPEDGVFNPEPLSSEAYFPEFNDLVVEQLMVPSHDGVKVPLSLIYRKETKMDGKTPLFMLGYGAYGISRTPMFSPYTLLWAAKGGILAITHVRGGGEMGDSWHMAGQKTTKYNTWKDANACAEYLIDHRYSSSDHMALYSASAGGILAGMAMNERPDLYAAVIPAVGIMNPLRNEMSPNGPVNAPEFGTVKDSAECMALIKMDSYQNISYDVDYPATLVTAGFNDSRVIVWQPAKYAARLEAANSSKNPILFSVDYTAGHGLGDNKTKRFEGLADIFAFALWQTGHPEFQK